MPNTDADKESAEELVQKALSEIKPAIVSNSLVHLTPSSVSTSFLPGWKPSWDVESLDISCQIPGV